ncbi:hypothetical protein GLOTRDRAFT_76404 [Gloeophyllum trabeum ATCC 11539]|uniref:NF-kappa-B inhibitor-like protein 1 n=1 Tax=Gloeophyllum trabeum (strain ATCC 11539 / FP-39264 / Madison 617) TaxID=670483 RepID=S7RQE3_GLOTA|nr:uncharacterized protein GLOTRDRAFT_76404 [Gloeophyllum trabeum ATCC 11539]EPQ55104.1 hypothetical protein GLOTRDRAFT_76404 [Gloeophyllum trabeum ATCC 11539]
MGSGKLHLKETSAERQERELRKARKAARRAAKRAERHRSRSSSPSDDRSTNKRRRRDPARDPWNSGDAYGPPPPGSHSKPDYETLQAELEEQRWREKMWDAMDEDSTFAASGTSRLDALEAEMNAHAHVPKRWRGPHAGLADTADLAGLDPSQMEDEEYAEWVRIGMWRKKNPDYYAEQERLKTEERARKAREQAIRDETRRLHLQYIEETKQTRVARDRKRTEEARERYEAGWKTLLSSKANEAAPELAFADIPWPVSVPRKHALSLDDISRDCISSFLFSTLQPDADGKEASGDTLKTRKEIVRETLLRFHPDKFEGRVLRRVKDADKDTVREAVGRVARALNELMAKDDA